MYVFGSGRGGMCGGECVRGLCLSFTNLVRTGRVRNVCLYLGCGGMGVVGGEKWVGNLGKGLGG